MLELAEIFICSSRFRLLHKCMNNMFVQWGRKSGCTRTLIGLRVARANADKMGMQVLVNQLRALFPESPEYQRYLQLQYSTEAVWK